MAKSKAKDARGRKPLDPEGPRTDRMAFRAKNEVYAYLQEQVDSGASTTLATAINDSISRLIALENQQQESLKRCFGGGFHNLALAHLIARIAFGIERKAEKSWWSEEKGLNPKLLIQILLTIIMIFRDFVRPTMSIYDLAYGLERSKFDRTTEQWFEVVSEFRANLNNPPKAWWLIGDTADGGPISPEKTLKFFAKLPRTEDPTDALIEPLRRAVLNQEAESFERWLKQAPAIEIPKFQSDLVRDGHQPEKMTGMDLAVAIKKWGQTELKKSPQEFAAENQEAPEEDYETNKDTTRKVIKLSDYLQSKQDEDRTQKTGRGGSRRESRS